MNPDVPLIEQLSLSMQQIDLVFDDREQVDISMKRASELLETIMDSEGISNWEMNRAEEFYGAKLHALAKASRREGNLGVAKVLTSHYISYYEAKLAKNMDLPRDSLHNYIRLGEAYSTLANLTYKLNEGNDTLAHLLSFINGNVAFERVVFQEMDVEFQLHTLERTAHILDAYQKQSAWHEYREKLIEKLPTMFSGAPERIRFYSEIINTKLSPSLIKRRRTQIEDIGQNPGDYPYVIFDPRKVKGYIQSSSMKEPSLFSGNPSTG